MPLDHDERCNLQDRELTLLKEQYRALESWMREVTDRVQRLVNEMHDQNVKQGVMQSDITHIKGKLDEIEDTLKHDVAPKATVDAMRTWGTMVGGAFLLAFIGAIAAFVIKGGLRP